MASPHVKSRRRRPASSGPGDLTPQQLHAKHAFSAALALAGGYAGASRSRPALRHFDPVATDADDDIGADLPTLRARSRDLARNVPLAGGALNTMVTNVVGTGLTMQSRIDADALGLDADAADAWQRATEREWRGWAESRWCDATLGQDFYGLQSLAFRSALESGDVLAITPAIPRPGSSYRLTVQMIEADLLCNPDYKADTDRRVAGIDLDNVGAPVRYHFANRHPNTLRRGSGVTWTAVEARGARSGRPNVIHLFDRRRPGQTRGVPVLAPVIEPLKQLGRYTEAELQAAVLAGAFAVFVKMDPAAFADLFGDDETLKTNYLAPATRWDGRNTSSVDGPGRAVNLVPGESVDTVNPGRPNDSFDPFVQAILRQIGAALELPFELLIKHYTSSYSAARAALLDAYRFFRGRRAWLASHYCQPIYELWLAEAVALGRVQAPGFFADPAARRAYSGAEWVGDGPGSIDPLKEVDAAERRLAIGTSTLAAESVLHDGIDWETKHRQQVREQAARAAAGLTAAPAAPRPPEPADPNA